jgi:hypothetical protein
MHSIIHTNQQLPHSWTSVLERERELQAEALCFGFRVGFNLQSCRRPLPCDLLSLDRLRLWIPTLLTPQSTPATLPFPYAPFAAQKRR